LWRPLTGRTVQRSARPRFFRCAKASRSRSDFSMWGQAKVCRSIASLKKSATRRSAEVLISSWRPRTSRWPRAGDCLSGGELHMLAPTSRCPCGKKSHSTARARLLRAAALGGRGSPAAATASGPWCELSELVDAGGGGQGGADLRGRLAGKRDAIWLAPTSWRPCGKKSHSAARLRLLRGATLGGQGPECDARPSPPHCSQPSPPHGTHDITKVTVVTRRKIFQFDVWGRRLIAGRRVVL